MSNKKVDPNAIQAFEEFKTELDAKETKKGPDPNAIQAFKEFKAELDAEFKAALEKENKKKRY